MDELVKRVSETTGISEDKARSAVNVVVGFLKDRLPAPLAGQVESALSGGGLSGSLGDIAGKAGSLFDK
jgi:uncharacterized protein (DUF2267 family)